jgi:histidyl-tRNA synthetase
MRDILPDEAELRDRTAQTILTVYRQHGFRRVETPALESIRLLTGGQGGENEKLVFKVLKRGEKLDWRGAASEADLVDLGLRFDLTVPLARYYAHNHAKLPMPLKAVQIGPVWRAERPQKGRFRQFTQCDIDILGVRSEIAEIELILATTEALEALGLQDLAVHINDRRILTAVARACGFEEDRHDSVFITLDKWDKLEKAEVVAELTRTGHPAAAIGRMMEIFDRGELTTTDIRQVVKDAAGIDANDSMKRIIDGVRSAHGAIRFDPRLVRGMSYYTGPIFEVKSAAFPSSIAGGGRYDHMIGKLLGRDVPATGFSIGFERVVSILGERPGAAAGRRKRVALIVDETGVLAPALDRAAGLRAEGLDVSLELRGKKRAAQLVALAAHGFDGVVEGPEASVQWFGGER